MKDEIIKQIETHRNNLLKARAFSPYMEFDLVGQTEFETPDFYKNVLGYSIKFNLQLGLTKEQIIENRRIGQM